jgi:hypothetical protein
VPVNDTAAVFLLDSLPFHKAGKNMPVPCLIGFEAVKNRVPAHNPKSSHSRVRFVWCLSRRARVFGRVRNELCMLSKQYNHSLFYAVLASKELCEINLLSQLNMLNFTLDLLCWFHS